MWSLILKLAGWLLGKLTGGGKDKALEQAEELGGAKTRDAVSSAALKRNEEDRKSKERTDAEVRATGYDDRVGRL